ncbi:MAG: hypothetical protein LBT55_01000 [Clostridiaceae bacterium]|jgi:hypothetical protein|nr:hypothetical protein [Clostridiaceae bacterium]
MKKAALLIMLAAVAAFSLFVFAACNNTPPEKLMSPAWNSYEKLSYAYDHYDGDTIVSTGTYTAEIDYIGYINDSVPPVKVGGVEIPLKDYKEGYLVTTTLVYGESGEFTKTVKTFFYRNANGLPFYPAVSFTTITGDVVPESLLIVYKSDRSIQTTYTKNDIINTSSDTRFNKKGGLVFDNATIYYALRALPLEDAPQISFETTYRVDGSVDASIAKMSVAAGADTNISDTRFTGAVGKELVPCYTVSINRDTSLQGTGYYVYYAKEAVSKADGDSLRTVNKVPVRIKEGSTVYNLTAISVSREDA